jgi:anti-sigma factor RsiW
VNDEQLEFAISQLADGTLDDAAAAELRHHLDQDESARRLLAEYQGLDQVLRVAAGPLPAVGWDELAARISAQIDGAGMNGAPADGYEEQRALRLHQPTMVFRAAALRRTVWRAGTALALAASVMIVATIAVRALRTAAPTGPAGGSSEVAVTATQPPAVSVIQGPVAQASAGQAVTTVSIGPSPALAEAGSHELFADSVIYHPPGVVIGSGDNPAQDDGESALSPYQR